MVDLTIDVEVAFAMPDKQLSVTVKVAEKTTVQQAINGSGILKQFPEIDLAKMRVGIFAKVCELDKTVEQGDRIEIYRPLLQNPMEARRSRAVNR